MPEPSFMLTQAAEAGQNILNTGMGLALEGHNDRRQLRQQEKLQNLQISGNKTMLDYNMMKQLEMWKNTSFSAQKEQLIKAGLNPGLIYGMGGAGGSTTGSGGGGVSGAQAPTGGGEIATQMGMGIQRELLQAQKENIEADTANKKATHPQITTQTASIAQGITNAKIQESILKWEDNLKRIESNIAEQTQGDRMGQIVSLAEQAASTAEMIERDNTIAAETKQSKIDEIKAKSIGAVINNEKMASEILQKWKELEIREGEMNIKAFEAQLKAEYPGVFNVVGGAINGVIRILSGNKKFESSENPIKK